MPSKGGFNERSVTIIDMKVDTHSLLLDAALFGSPPAVCRSAQWEAATPPADPPTAADRDGQTAKSDTSEPPKPNWPA